LKLGLIFEPEEGGDMHLRNLANIYQTAMSQSTVNQLSLKLGLIFEPEEGGDMYLRNLANIYQNAMSQNTVNQARNQLSLNPGLIFEPEEGGDMYLRNVGFFPELHYVITKNTVLFMVTGVGTSNLTFYYYHSIVMSVVLVVFFLQVFLRKFCTVTYMSDYTLQITGTRTCVLSLLQSLLAVSWQRILTQEL
jgi:hypothetical protein